MSSSGRDLHAYALLNVLITAAMVISMMAVDPVRGDGPLFPGAHYAAGDGPESVAIGDLDGDQVPDLVVANEGSDNVSVLLGVGDGTFAAAVNYAAGNGPASVAIGDLDGDQVADHLGVSPATVTHRMDRVRREWEVFQGEHP